MGIKFKEKIMAPQWFFGRNEYDAFTFDLYDHMDAYEEICAIATHHDDLQKVKHAFIETAENSSKRLALITQGTDRLSDGYFDKVNAFLHSALLHCDGIQYPPDALVLFVWDAARDYGNRVLQDFPGRFEWGVHNNCPDRSQKKLSFEIDFDKSMHLKPFEELYANSSCLLRGEGFPENYFRETSEFLFDYVND